MRQISSSNPLSAEYAKATLLRTLAADVLQDRGAVSRGHAIDFSYEERHHSSLTSEKRRKKSEIITSLKISTYARRLRTFGDRVGLALLDAEVGDKVCVFYTGSVHYIIRQNKEKPGYTFVGECYVDDFIDGDASALLREGSMQEEMLILV